MTPGRATEPEQPTPARRRWDLSSFDTVRVNIPKQELDVSMGHAKMNATTADGVTTVRRIGEPLDRLPDARIEQALRNLGWNEGDVEQGVRRAVYNGHGTAQACFSASEALWAGTE
jgi:hypothetical protein